ncbi:hypothetical protein [Kineococcus terrestris]|uniref:hypothetical protein n=1 Tax=Kineococcus terrestris TaxID=2044856 RepID=UPI0034DAC19A
MSGAVEDGAVTGVDEAEPRPGGPVGALASAALAGLAVGVVLLVAGGAWLQQAGGASGAVPWGALVTLVLAVGSLAWGGLAALAHWVCAALLERRTPAG